MSQVKALDTVSPANTSCLRRPLHKRGWRGLFGGSGFKRKVRFDPSADETITDSDSKKIAEECEYRRTYMQAEDLLCSERFPPLPVESFSPFTEIVRPVIPSFDTRCQGLIQASKLAYRLHHELPPFIIIARVWREFPIRRHSISFDLSALRAPLFTDKKRREPAKVKWLLLLLNRVLMSEPSYDHEQFLGCLHRMRRLDISHSGPSLPNFFAFTPALWSIEDFSVGDVSQHSKFVDEVSDIYNPKLCGSVVEKQIQRLVTKKMRRAMRIQCMGPDDMDDLLGSNYYFPSAKIEGGNIMGNPVEVQNLDSAATTTCPSSNESEPEDSTPSSDDNASLLAQKSRLLCPYRPAEWLYTVNCDGTIPNAPMPTGRTIAAIPSYLLEGNGIKLHDIRQFKLILRTMKSFFSESVALRLLLDDILDII